MADYDLVLERTLDAPLELVWRAWTDPEHLKQWWAPKQGNGCRTKRPTVNCASGS